MDSSLDKQEAVCAGRIVGDFAEVGRGWVQGRHIELRAVEGIEGVQPYLEFDSFADPEFALDVGIQPVQAVGAAGADTAGEDPGLKCRGLQRGVSDKAGGVKPMVGNLGPAGADVIRVVSVEKIAPGEKRAGLNFKGGRLPASRLALRSELSSALAVCLCRMEAPRCQLRRRARVFHYCSAPMRVGGRIR